MRSFHLEKRNKLFEKVNSAKHSCLFGPFQRSNRRSQTFRKTMHKIFGNWKVFFVFCVTLRRFHLDDCNKLFRKAYWTTDSLLVDPFQRCNPQSRSKMGQEKCIKLLQTGNYLFCFFRCQFETFSFRTLQLSP